LLEYAAPPGVDANEGVANNDVGAAHVCLEVPDIGAVHDDLSGDVEFLSPPQTLSNGAQVACPCPRDAGNGHRSAGVGKDNNPPGRTFRRRMTAQHTVTVIGAGDMGHGFATLFTVKGQSVTLVDHRQSNLDEAAERTREVVSFLAEEGETDRDPDAVVDDIEFTTDLAAGVAGTDLVLESVPEDLSVKQDTYREVAENAPNTAVLASNTSGIPITDIAEAVPDHAGRVVGCHWWYPPYLLPSVEVVRGEETSDETVERVRAFLDAVDRKPVMVERDIPGFVWNRIQMAIFRESLHLVEEGVTSFEDIDRAIRDGYALRTAAIGPFETMDIAGLDLVQTVLDNLSPHLCDDDEASPLFEEYLDEGRGGIHDGAGFYDYDHNPEEVTHDRDETVMALRRAREKLGE